MPYDKHRSAYHSGPNTNRRRGPTYGAQKRQSSNSRGPRGQYIDPARFVKVAGPASASVFVPINTFDDFEINPLIKANLATKGFTVPTPIQDQIIPLALAGRDVIGIADTGTGKTIAFAVPLLNKLQASHTSSALIVAPTRELAQQIEEQCAIIGRGGNLNTALLIGGSSMGRQLSDLRRRPSLVIGTPGRIKDHLERRTLKLANFGQVVLDEVDRMLDMGFINDVRAILGQLSPDRQSFFFSATMDKRTEDLVRTFSNEPELVSVKSGQTSENVNQDVIRFEHSSEKLTKLHDLLNDDQFLKVLIFDETQRSVERLSNKLNDRGFNTDSIHGGKSQGQRRRALDNFKRNQIRILVATDVAARGIDVADISHVINFSQPKSYDDYVHRIGRAGRAGKAGQALTFVAR